VRLELARAYFMAEDWADARREFFAVLSADVPQRVKDNIIVFLRLIDVRRGWSWDLDAGIRGGPESGRRYKSDTVMLNIFGQALPFEVDRPSTPDHGAFVAGGLEFRETLMELEGATLSGIARVDGEANIYDDDDFNELIYGGSLAAQLAWARTSLRVGPDVLWRRFGGDERDRRWGVAASVEHRLPAGIALFSRVGWSRVEDALSDNRDGDLKSLRLGLSRSIGGRSSLTGLVSASTFDARIEPESYWSGRAELRGRTELGWGLAPTLSLALTHTRYRERNPSSSTAAATGNGAPPSRSRSATSSSARSRPSSRSATRGTIPTSRSSTTTRPSTGGPAQDLLKRCDHRRRRVPERRRAVGYVHRKSIYD
jgi:hypothetical protein